jgi:Ca-activated chloride channel family protein
LNILFPENFWLLLILLPMVYLSITTFRRRQKDLDVLAGRWRGPRMKGLFLLKTVFRELFFLGGVMLLILSLAGFFFGVEPVEEEGKGLQVGFVLDISRSMLTRDLRPSRLTQSTLFMKGLVESLQGHSFSLTIFKGDGVTVVPLTYDGLVLEQYLDQVGPSFSTSPGTNIEAGIRAGWRSLQSGIPQFKVLIVVSDGENLSGNVRGIQEEIRVEEGHLLMLSAGTPEGGTIPLADGEFVLDAAGEPVVSRARPEILRSIAGPDRFWDIGEPRTQTAVVEYLKNLDSPELRGGVKYKPIPRFGFFVFGALVLFFMEMIFRVWKWKKVF